MILNACLPQNETIKFSWNPWLGWLTLAVGQVGILGFGQFFKAKSIRYHQPWLPMCPKWSQTIRKPLRNIHTMLLHSKIQFFVNSHEKLWIYVQEIIKKTHLLRDSLSNYIGFRADAKSWFWKMSGWTFVVKRSAVGMNCIVKNCEHVRL